tara:strand:+ start:153 stop:608 length:456 start_codon:yes stop_codon:yes gene_type:complete
MKKIYKPVLVFVSIIFLIFLTSCTNRKIITVEKKIRRIDIIDHKGYLIKSYYQKYNNNYPGWYDCNVIKEVLNKKSLKCDFTNSALKLIDSLKENTKFQMVTKNLNNNNLEQIQREQQQNQEEEQEEEQENQQEEEQENQQEEEQETERRE